MHSEWYYIMWIPAQEKEHKPSCAPTIFMISQFGYHLNLKQVTLQFNIVTNSRQKTFIVFESSMSTVSSFMYCETSVPKEWHTEIYFGSISKTKTAISLEWLGIHIRTSRSDLYSQGKSIMEQLIHQYLKLYRWEKLTSPCKPVYGKSKHNRSFAMHTI